MTLLDGEPVTSLADHEARGGLTGLDVAGRLGREGVLDEVTAAGLRGRGGAGFPAGLKWRSIVGGESTGERFVVANGAEGEPGSFKDRAIMRHDPYAVIEGLLIAAQTVGARRAFIAVKAGFTTERDRLAAAAGELAAAGVAPEVGVEIAQGPDEYLFGEEKALLEVIEGEEPLPRLFPPYIYGLFTTSPQVGWSAGRQLTADEQMGANPTLVNNVETLARVPGIVAHGADHFRSSGTAESPGTVVCTVSGDTVRHGVGEFEMGTPLSTVIEELGGGLPPGRAVKYVLSGVANPVIRADHLDVPLTYEHLEAVGSGLGTAGFMVFDDRTDPAELGHAVSRFLWVESCGQCPACKLGTGRITELLATAMTGPADRSELAARLDSVDDSARCYLPTQEQRLISSLLPDLDVPAFRQPARGLVVTKIVDLVGDRFALDERQARKRPDWTYGPEAED